MGWQGTRDKADPALTNANWTAIKKYWRLVGPMMHPHCWRCGRPINWDIPYRDPQTGRVNRSALAVGHVTSRAEARRLGWPEEMINTRANTRPEHAACSSRSGAVAGNRSPRRKADRRIQALQAQQADAKSGTQTQRWLVSDRW